MRISPRFRNSRAERTRWSAFLLTIAAAAAAVQTGWGAAEYGLLVGDTPDWYTPQLHAEVLASGEQGSPLPEGTLLPSLTGVFAGVRPGSWMVSPNWCTTNFLFNSSGLYGTGPYYIGTAKHCVQSQISSQDPSSGPIKYDPNESVIGKHVVMAVSLRPGEPPRLIDVGTVAYATDGNGRIGQDFALIQIRQGLEQSTSPSIAEIGGPTSTFNQPLDSSIHRQPIQMVGHGVVLGSGGTARPGILTAFNPQTPSGYGMVIPAISGDSGSPVRTEKGAAVGNITSIGYHPGYTGAVAFGTRVSLVESLWGLKVVVCPGANPIPWPFLGCPSV